MNLKDREWDRERGSRRGGAPNLAQIVASAIMLADQEGLDGLSLRRVATSLGSGTASFYRVLNGREELLDHMVDTVLGHHLPPEPLGDWHGDLAALARNRRAMLGAHPWLGTELAGRPAVGPNALAHYERALTAAAGYSDDPTVASSAVETVLAYVLGATVRDSAELQIRRRSGLTTEQWRATVAPHLRRALDSGAYPHLQQMVHHATDLGPDQRFEQGLTCVLAGLLASAHWPVSSAIGQ